MKRLLLMTALLPFTAFTQPLNTMNNPNMQGYQIPSQQRMQTQMQTQQIQQQGMLKQQVQTQARSQQQNLQSQLNANTQRVQQGQPGIGMLGQQTLPNTQAECSAEPEIRTGC